MKIRDTSEKVKIPVESMKAIEAFEYYYVLGDDRSLPKVAEHFGVSRPTVDNWSVWYNWRYRVVERNNKIAEQLRLKTDREIINDKIEYRNIIKTILKSFIKDVKSGKVACKSINDFYKLINLDLSIQGSLRDDFTAQKLEQMEAKMNSKTDKLTAVSNETLDTLNKLLEELGGSDES